MGNVQQPKLGLPTKSKQAVGNWTHNDIGVLCAFTQPSPPGENSPRDSRIEPLNFVAADVRRPKHSLTTFRWSLLTSAATVHGEPRLPKLDAYWNHEPEG